MSNLINSVAEGVVLGAILAQPEAIVELDNIVRPADFATPMHQWLATAAWECLQDRTPPTLAAVIGKLQGAGRWSDRVSKSAACMEDLDALVASVSDADVTYIKQNAGQVAALALRRNGHKELVELARLFESGDLPPEQIQGEINKRVGAVFAGRAGRDGSLAAIGTEEEARLAKGVHPGTTCGIKWLDSAVGGFQPGEVWVLGGAYKSSKCVRGDTLVLTADGMRPIEEIARAEKPGYYPKEILVWGRNGWQYTSHIYHAEPDKTIKLTTKGGFFVEGTPEHPILVAIDGGVAWKRLGDITQDDFVAIDRKLPNAGTNWIPDPLVARRSRKECLFPQQMSHELARLMGHLTADGTMGGEYDIQYTKSDPVLVDDFISCLWLEFGVSPIQIDPINFRVYNTNVRQWLAAAGMDVVGSPAKRIPRAIWSAENQYIASFLNALFSGDGYVVKKSGSNSRPILLTSASLGLIRDVQTALLRFGIIGRIGASWNKTYERDYYTIRLDGDNAVLFMEKIGLISKHKSDRAMERVSAEMSTQRRHSTDPVRGMRKTLKGLYGSMPAHLRNRTMLKLFSGRCEGDPRNVELTYRRGRRILEAIGSFDNGYVGLLRQAVERNYYFDRVESLEEGFAETFDLTVPEGHSFFSGGFISHNTRLVTNMALAAARSGSGVSMFTVGDSTRSSTYRQMLSMEMNRLMLEPPGTPPGTPVASAQALRYELQHPVLKQLKVDAAARLKPLPIHLYDGQDRVGYLSEAERLIRRDVALYNTKIVVYDFAQACWEGLNDYEKSMRVAPWSQQMATELGITLVVLSQLSEEAIKHGANSQSPGAKGGGALPAAANVFLVTTYQEPTLKIQLKLARGAGAVAGGIDHLVSPASGLILDANK